MFRSEDDQGNADYSFHWTVLILVVMDVPLGEYITTKERKENLMVLILVVMDVPLGGHIGKVAERSAAGLNPFCNGCSARRVNATFTNFNKDCLYPCCN